MSPHRSPHILIVDDDRSVLDILTRALDGYRLSIAGNATAALHLASTAGTLDLLITDYLMPSMTGAELIGRLRAQQPTLKVLILTGHGNILDHERPAWWAADTHLAKPPHLETLRATVAGLIGPA
jgi:DNA-binding NtrC family response regulator